MCRGAAILVLVGPDKCGKTTLAATLIKDLLPGYAYKHHGVPPVEPYSYFGWFLHYARPDVVVDRLHYCELAYGLTYRGVSKLSDHEWRLLELAALAHRAQVIWLDDDAASIRSRWDDKETFDAARLEQLQTSYEIARSRSSLKWHKHSLTDLLTCHGKGHWKPTKALNSILNQELANLAVAELLPAPNVGWGNTEPGGFLVIGESPSFYKKEGDIRPRGPFCWGFSGDHLWQTIDQLGIDWSKGYYTNSNAFENFEADLVEIINPKVVITLGKRAEAAYPKGVAMSHPHFDRRFKTHSDDWAEELKTVLSEFVKLRV